MNGNIVPVEVVDDAVVVRGKKEADCVCGEKVDHIGPHRCPCGGGWHYDADGQFHPGTFPGSALGWSWS